MEYYNLEDKLNDAIKFDKEVNTESDLYIKDNDLLKLLYIEHRTIIRQNTIERLSELNDKRFVVPKYGLLDQYESFRGFGMDYLKDYSTLINYLNVNNINLNKRKQMCFDIYDMCDDLSKLGFFHIDIHLDNFMIKDNDIKAIDLDSSRLNESLDEYSLEELKKFRDFFLSQMFLQILFNPNSHFSTKNITEQLENANDKEFILICYSHHIGDKIDLKECVNGFEESFIESHNKLKKRY